MNILNDSWEVTGKSIENFILTLKELEENTEVLRVPSRDITVLSNIIDDVYYKICSTLEECNFNLPKVKLRGILDVALQHELEKNTHTLFNIKDYGYFFLSNNLSTLGSRTGIGEAIGNPSLERDLHIFRLLNKTKSDVTLVIRKQGAVKKIEAVMSKGYGYISQDIIPSLIKEIEVDLGTVSDTRWVTNNHVTKFCGFFEEKRQEVASSYGKQDLLPGVFVMTSDTGDASFRMHECWKKKDCIVIMPEGVIRKHLGDVNIPLLTSQMKKVWGDFKKVPDRMLNMMATPVVTKNDETEAREELGEFLTRLFESVKFEKKFGKKFTKKLILTLQLQTDYEMDSQYELYDNIMQYQEEITKGRKEEYQKMLGNLLLSDVWA